MDADLRARLATLLGDAYPDRADALLAEVESWYAVDTLGWDCARCLSRGETDWLAGLDIGPRSFQGGGRTSVPKVSLQPATVMQPAFDVDEELEDETWDRARVPSVPMIALCQACLETLDAGFDAAVGEQLDPSMVLSELSRALRVTAASDSEKLLAELEKRRGAAAGERRCPFCEENAPTALLRLGVHRVCRACLRHTRSEARRLAGL